MDYGYAYSEYGTVNVIMVPLNVNRGPWNAKSGPGM